MTPNARKRITSNLSEGAGRAGVYPREMPLPHLRSFIRMDIQLAFGGLRWGARAKRAKRSLAS
eukprot:7763921-Alexandrium_andersonii.AAC.1